jgi:hypothetical protein
VRHDQHHQPADTSHRLPPCFSLHNSIQAADDQRILKYEQRGFKADPMLLKIPPILARIPSKSHEGSYKATGT